MTSYRFLNVKRIKNEHDALGLLSALGRHRIAGGVSFDEKSRNLEILFLGQPPEDLLNFLKNFLEADGFEEVELEEVDSDGD